MNRTKESNVAKVVNGWVEPVFFFVVRGFVVDTKLPALAKSQFTGMGFRSGCLDDSFHSLGCDDVFGWSDLGRRFRGDRRDSRESGWILGRTEAGRGAWCDDQEECKEEGSSDHVDGSMVTEIDCSNATR